MHDLAIELRSIFCLDILLPERVQLFNSCKNIHGFSILLQHSSQFGFKWTVGALLTDEHVDVNWDEVNDELKFMRPISAVLFRRKDEWIGNGRSKSLA